MKRLGLGLNLSTKNTRKREFLEEMERVVPWGVLVQIVAPYYPKAKNGLPPFGIETMLRIHYLQQWFGLSDPTMEEALHDVPLYTQNVVSALNLEVVDDPHNEGRKALRVELEHCYEFEASFTAQKARVLGITS